MNKFKNHFVRICQEIAEPNLSEHIIFTIVSKAYSIKKFEQILIPSKDIFKFVYVIQP